MTARVERWQWMRNAEGGQDFGNQWELRPLTATRFHTEIRPYLPVDGPRTWRAYRAQYPTHTHYACARRVTWARGAARAAGPWCPLVPLAGALDELRPRGLTGALWARRVDRWDSRAALRWGRRADTDALGLHDRELDRLRRASELLRTRRGRLARGLAVLFARFLRDLFEGDAMPLARLVRAGPPRRAR